MTVPRLARHPRSRRDAAQVTFLLVLLESALAAFLFLSATWLRSLEDPARSIVLAFTVATALAFILFGMSLLGHALPVLFGRTRRGS